MARSFLAVFSYSLLQGVQNAHAQTLTVRLCHRSPSIEGATDQRALNDVLHHLKKASLRE
jgi:hypothetical protein